MQTRLLGATVDSLKADEVLMDACCYRIVIIGEAIDMGQTHLRSAFSKVKLQATNWDGVVQIRNAFVHEYAQVKPTAIIMFGTITADLRRSLNNVLGNIG